MVVHEPVWGKLRNGIKHFRWLGWMALGMGVMFLATRWNPPLHVDSIFVAYPYDERSLIVERSGHAELSRRGVKAELRRRSFDVDDLFQLIYSSY